MKIKFKKVHDAWNTLRADNPIKVGDIAELDGHIITLEDKSQLNADELCKLFSNHCSYSDIFDKAILFDADDAEAILYEYSQDCERMLSDANSYFTNAVCECAELRGNLIPDAGDEPRYLSWSDPDEVDTDEFVKELIEYAELHLKEGYKQFSITLSCYISGTNPDSGMEERWGDTVDVEAFEYGMYDILSPDGFSIHPVDNYISPAKAWEAFEVWKKRFETQGYYSSNGGRIPLDNLKSACKLVTL